MLYGEYMYDVTSTDELIKETRESKKRTEPAATAIPPVHQPRTIPRSAVSGDQAEAPTCKPRAPNAHHFPREQSVCLTESTFTQ